MTEQKSDNLLKHGSIMLAATLIGGVTNYLYHFLMIRLLSPAEYGALYSLLALFMIIGVPIGTISIVITKYVSNYKGTGDENKISLLFERSLKLLGWLGLALFILFVVSGRFIGDYLKIQSVIPILVIGLILSLSFVSTATTGVLQGLQEFFILGGLAIAGALAKVIFGVILVVLHFGVTGALLGPLISSFIGLIIAFLPLKRYFHYERNEETSLDKKEIYQYFVPVAIAIFCYGFLTYFDAIIVKHYFTPVVAGYYATCALIGKAFLFPPAAFSGALFPKVSEMHAAGKSPLPLLKKAMTMNVAVLIAGVVVCVAFPHFLVNVLLKGKEILPGYYENMIFLMRIFGIMVIPYGLLNIVVYYNLAMHKTGFLFILTGGAVLLVAALFLFHSTLTEVVLIFGAVGYLIFAASLAAVFFTRGVEGEGVSGEDIYINAGVQ